VYLIILSLFDLKHHIHLRIFFCNLVDEIHKNRKEIRENICKNYNHENDECPIFSILDKNEKDLKKRCPEIFVERDTDNLCEKKSKQFWKILIDGFIIFHQATFFEIIAIQFIILGAVSQSIVIGVICVVTGIILLITCVEVYTYHLNIQISLFSNIWLRLIFLFGFIAMFLILTSFIDIKFVDTYFLNMVSSFKIQL
jgi:hypothetical protein